jgi:uncharacterized metal-binding protein YceD (DUF177 family)
VKFIVQNHILVDFIQPKSYHGGMVNKHDNERSIAQLKMPTTAQIKSHVVPTQALFRSAIEGKIAPQELPELTEFLAAPEGEILYRFVGKILTDQIARQKRQVKCIISGWLTIADAKTLQPTRFPLDITSKLVLVASEDEFPPLEEECEDEDTVVCGAEFDVGLRVQEEILLAMPVDVPRVLSHEAEVEREAMLRKLVREVRGGHSVAAGALASVSPTDTSSPISPFAKLAALKKTDD